MTTVHINEIDSVDECQVRLSLDKDMVEHYAEVYRNGGTLPHLSVYKVGKRLVLVDGYHRLAAAAVAEKAKVPIEIVGTGEIEEAREWALTANQKHGLPLRKEDRIRAIELAMKLPKYKDASDQVLSELLGISRRTVNRLRGKEEPNNLAIGQVEHLSMRNQVDGPPDGWAIEPEPDQNDHICMVTETIEVPKAPVKRLGKDGKWRAAAGRKPKTAWPGTEELNEAEKRIRRLATDLVGWSKKLSEPFSRTLTGAADELRMAASGIALGTAVDCIKCGGKKCSFCGNRGWVPMLTAKTFKERE